MDSGCELRGNYVEHDKHPVILALQSHSQLSKGENEEKGPRKRLPHLAAMD